MYFSVVAYNHAYSSPTANEHRHYITGFAKTPDILANFICKWTTNKFLYIWFQHGLFLTPAASPPKTRAGRTCPHEAGVHRAVHQHCHGVGEFGDGPGHLFPPYPQGDARSLIDLRINIHRHRAAFEDRSILTAPSSSLKTKPQAARFCTACGNHLINFTFPVSLQCPPPGSNAKDTGKRTAQSSPS